MTPSPSVKTVTATRYVTPLREGGSLPAIVEADDGELYAMKFVGAGQGPKALIAELIAGALAQAVGLPIPDLVLIELDPLVGRSEPDPEIQDILQGSAGLNLGLRYLSGALPFNPLQRPAPSPDLASQIVWFDAYITNVDRTARNVNLLMWQEQLWLIDHGAALYFHHSWQDYMAKSQSPFALIKNHVLLPFASQLDEADVQLRSQITLPFIEQLVDLIPAAWLGEQTEFVNQAEHRAAYVAYLTNRLEAAPIFLQEAQRAKAEYV